MRSYSMRISNIDSNLSFQAMKPNQFSGIDYAVVRKFKAPVEKFNSNIDFQVWVNTLLKKICQPEDKKEFQGEKNNMILPEEYNIKVKKHLKEGEYFLNDDIGFLIDIIDHGI